MEESDKLLTLCGLKFDTKEEVLSHYSFGCATCEVIHENLWWR